jgi:hypothetical protein
LPVPQIAVGWSAALAVITLLRYAPARVPAVPANPVVTSDPAASVSGAAPPPGV